MATVQLETGDLCFVDQDGTLGRYDPMRREYLDKKPKSVESYLYEGYVWEGSDWSRQTTGAGGAVPLYQLHNLTNVDVLYTTSAVERDATVSLGYQHASMNQWIFDVDAPGRLATHRLYERQTGNHYFTHDLADADKAVDSGF